MCELWHKFNNESRAHVSIPDAQEQQQVQCGLTISIIVFTSIIIKKKKAHRTDLATWRRAHASHEEEDPGQQPLTRRITAASESKCTAVANATI